MSVEMRMICGLDGMWLRIKCRRGRVNDGAKSAKSKSSSEVFGVNAGRLSSTCCYEELLRFLYFPQSASSSRKRKVERKTWARKAKTFSFCWLINTYSDVRPSTLWRASTGRLLSPQFCNTRRFKDLSPMKASRSIVSNLLSDNVLWNYNGKLICCRSQWGMWLEGWWVFSSNVKLKKKKKKM